MPLILLAATYENLVPGSAVREPDGMADQVLLGLIVCDDRSVAGTKRRGATHPGAGRRQTGFTVDHEDLLVVGVCGNHQPRRSSPFHRVTNVLAEYTWARSAD
jgi:hypothetical protein